jgi:hypothetical protein
MPSAPWATTTPTSVQYWRLRTKKPIAISMPRNRNSRSAWICASVATGTPSRGVFESPACGPAAVTNVPAISSRYMTTAMTI